MYKKTFSIITLGCFRNNYDSEIVARRFLDQGYIYKEKSSSANTMIINTCGFIDKAKEESLDAIREVISLKEKGKVKKIFVFGCLVQRYLEDLKKFFPQVDNWSGIEEFKPQLIRRKKLLPSYIDFLKICEGCINRCSYCAIPLIKGNLVSKSKTAVIKEAKLMDRAGVKELNIIGQDITSWGKDLGKNETLTTLLADILKNTKNIRWLRLIYAHPRHLSDSLLDLVASKNRICKYIDLPIQHINDRILKLMNRGTTKREIIKLIKKIRKKIPGCVIRTSVIVGFPTETKEEFSELLQFLKEVKFDRLGAFIYSREEETPAYDLAPQIHSSTKRKRFNEVMRLQRDIAKDINRKFLSKDLDVLIEEKDNNIYVGRSQYDAFEVDGAVFIRHKKLTIGDFYKAKIVDCLDYDLIGV